MEEILELFQGIMKIGTWSRKYVILRDNILTYCDKQGGEIEGRIHLRVAKVNELDPLKPEFRVDTGTTPLLFRAPNLASKAKWLNAMWGYKQTGPGNGRQ